MITGTTAPKSKTGMYMCEIRFVISKFYYKQLETISMYGYSGVHELNCTQSFTLKMRVQMNKFSFT